jgi:hypothetical protein
MAHPHYARPEALGPFPVVPRGTLGPAPTWPDLNQMTLVTVTTAAFEPLGVAWPAWVDTPEAETPGPRRPDRGLPGSWVTVLYRGEVRWAWIPDPAADPEAPVVLRRPGPWQDPG